MLVVAARSRARRRMGLCAAGRVGAMRQPGCARAAVGAVAPLARFRRAWSGVVCTVPATRRPDSACARGRTRRGTTKGRRATCAGTAGWACSALCGALSLRTVPCAGGTGPALLTGRARAWGTLLHPTAATVCPGSVGRCARGCVPVVPAPRVQVTDGAGTVCAGTTRARASRTGLGTGAVRTARRARSGTLG